MRILRALFVASVLCVASEASAEPTPTERALAQTMFDEGRQLMKDLNYAAACAKFVKSQQLDPSAGTFINLALCHEAEGKTATAWAEFNEALSQSLKDGRSDREQASREHIDKLAPALNRVTVSVPAAARVRGLEVELDSVPVREIAWGTAGPLDPGAHSVTVSAPGKKTWTRSLNLDTPGTSVIVEVPQLEDAASRPRIDADASSGEGLKRKTVGYIVGGGGVAALAIGTIFGVRAISKRSDSDAQCPNDVCTAKGVDLNDQAITSAWVSNVAILLGLAGVGVGTYLVLASPDAKPSATRIRFSPTAGAGRGGLAVGGTF